MLLAVWIGNHICSCDFTGQTSSFC